MIKCAEPFDSAYTDEPRKSAESQEVPIINRVLEGEPIATSPHFSGSRGGRFFNAADVLPAVSVGESNEDSDTARTAQLEMHARVNAMALRELDVEIAVRESELATMRRARAVLARDLERNRTTVACGHEAQEGT